MAGAETIAARWAALGQMDRAALRVAWVEAFGEAAPHYLSMIFMRKALIWKEQCRVFGGPSSDLRKALTASVEGRQIRPAVLAPPRAGTQLVREWNGRRYLVEVTGDGYLMNGERYKSLSAVAQQITGTTWSGPRFFGLTSRAGGAP